MKLLYLLQKYRLENRLSQEKLANLLGVHRVTLTRWLSRKIKPNQIQTYHIKKFLEENIKQKN